MNPSEQHVSDSADCWQQAKQTLSARRRALLPAIQDWALRQERIPILRALFEAPSASPAAAEIHARASERQKRAEAKQRLRELMQSIVQEFGRKEPGRDALIVIGRVIEASNRLRQEPLPLPPIPRKVRRQRDPFVDADVVAALRSVRELQHVEAEWIKAVTHGAVPRELILLSAILHGDLLHRSMLEALLERMETETRCPLEWWGETRPYRLRPGKKGVTHPFMDLSLSWGATADSELRRWFPDPLTACLLVYADYSGITPEVPAPISNRVDRAWEKLREELRARGIADGDLPRTLPRLFTTMRLARRADNYPSLIVGHCARSIISHALRPSVLPRVAGAKAVPQQTAASATEQEPPPVTLANRRDQDYESCWYGDLRAVLRGNDTRSIAAGLEALVASGAAYPESAKRIMEFAAFKVANGSAAGNRLKLSSVRTYTSLVARHLGGMLEGQDPAGLPISDLVSIYDQVLDAAEQGRNPRSKRRQVGRALHEFHHFLTQTYRIESVNPGAVFGIGRDLVPVDANLITIDEYFQIREVIAKLAPSDEIALIVRLLMTLGFRLGLRRMEAHGLRIKDVAEVGIPSLVIRDWAGRHLKTRGSARVLPLTLVPPPERAALLVWKQIRLQEHHANPDDYLFALPTTAREVIGIELFVLIHRAMRQVTNDQTLRYHHMRHSCANWAFLRLCLSDFSRIPDLFPKLRLTTDLLRDSPAFRRDMYNAFPAVAPQPEEVQNKHNKYSALGPTGQHAFAVAALLGHADPSTMLEHYIHLLDLVTPLYRQTSDFFPVPRNSLIVASRIPPSTASRYGDDLTAAAWVRIHAKTQPAPAAAAATGCHSTQAPPHCRISQVWQLLYDRETRSVPVDELAAEYGYATGAEVDTVVARARRLRDMVDPTHPDQPLYTMTPWTPDKRHPENTIRLACPWYPNHSRDRAVISQLETAIAALPPNTSDIAERAVDYFVRQRTAVAGEHADILVGHQTGIHPLVFANPEDAQCYLEFLDELHVQRKRITDRSGNVIQESDMRFIFYGYGKPVQAWTNELGINWRDDYEHEDIGRPDLVGILVHFQTAPTRKLVGNFGFRFVMLMAAIARPWLKQPDSANA